MKFHGALRRARDRWVLATSLAVTAYFVTITSLEPHRMWAQFSLVGYSLALACTLLPRLRGLAPAVAVLGAVVAPLLALCVRAVGQPEVTVLSDGAKAFLTNGSPYLADPQRLQDLRPYFPGMFIFGLPRALGIEGPGGDPRLWIALLFLTSLPLVLDRHPRQGSVDRHWLLPEGLCLFLAFPLVALTIAVSAIDIPICALSLLALESLRRRHHILTGMLSGAALSMKPTALFLVVALGVAAFTSSRDLQGRFVDLVRYLSAALGVLLLVMAPALLVDPKGWWSNAMAFPAGVSSVESPAQSPLPGVLITQHLPNGGQLARWLLAVSVVGGCLWLCRRRITTPLGVGRAVAITLTLAICVAPFSRVGYFVLPLTLALVPLWMAPRVSSTEEGPASRSATVG